MTTLTFTLLVGAGSFGGGLLGALTGLGGGIIVVPMLTLLFHVDLRYAIAASLVSIIATSSGAASAYVREGFTNVRVGILLEIATVIGALIGAALSSQIPKSALAVLFGAVLLFTAYRSTRPREEHALLTTPDKWSARLRLDSTYPTADGEQPYSVHNVPTGFLSCSSPGFFRRCSGLDRESSRFSRWIKRCGCRSRCRPRRATS
jgi:uncharacterized membrane protein YfcA